VKLRPAFTLIEAVLAIILTLILVTVAIGELSGVASWKAAAAVRRVQSDLLYARQAALISGRRTLCVFDLATACCDLKQEAAPGTGAITAVAINHPLTGAPWHVVLADLAPGLGVSFSPAMNPASIGFDGAGRPVTSAGAGLTSDLVLQFTSGARLMLRYRSGLCEVSWP
jgi:Tfp pilus assembly protein FimT